MRIKKTMMLAAVVAAVAAEAAQVIKLSDGWEFRRAGGVWERVTVPHDWAIAGPFDK